MRIAWWMKATALVAVLLAACLAPASPSHGPAGVGALLAAAWCVRACAGPMRRWRAACLRATGPLGAAAACALHAAALAAILLASLVAGQALAAAAPLVGPPRPGP
jgi:hypothetical protein